MKTVGETRGALRVLEACSAIGLPHATWYRARAPVIGANHRPRPLSPRALRNAERALVLDQLNSPRFADQAVPQVHATLRDEGTYLCSPRTMYRILDDLGQMTERRNQLRHPAYAKPELLASVPNQVWSWDITKLKGPSKWNRYQLYVILDIYSRYVVGWMVADRDSATLAKKLIEQTIRKQAVRRDQLTIHADRGTAITSKDVALLLDRRRARFRPHF